jgi:lipoprotein-releasing system permease protein
MASNDGARASASGATSSFELRMAIRYLTTRRREGPVAFVTLLCTGGVFVGVFALTLALALMSGLQGDIKTRLLASNAHVIVRPAPGEPRYDIAQAAEVSRIALSVPGVVAAAPFSEEWGVLRGPDSAITRPVNLKGVVPEAEDRVTGLAAQVAPQAWKIFSDDFSRASAPPPAADDGEGDEPLSFAELRPDAPPEVLLGDGLALELGVSPGDVVHLVTAGTELTATGPMLRSRAFMVAGLVHTGLFEYDQTWIVAALPRLAPPGAALAVHGVQLALAEPLRAAEVGDRVAAALGRGHSVADWTTTFSRLFAAFRWEKLIMMAALGLIGLVAGCNIFTILTLNVTARIADIGVLGALGAGTGAITRIFLWMGLVLGASGTLAGIAAGAVAAVALDRWRLVALDPSVYLVSHVPFHVVPSDLAIVAAGMLAVSFLATLAPARAAARLDPVVALRSA